MARRTPRKIAMRLRASGVHRAEFAPATPMDFDANCGLVYHYTRRSLENLVCDSPLGDGRVRLTGEKPGPDTPPEFTVEMDRIPVAAGLDALRTLRSGLDPDLEASGTVSGKIVYAAEAESAAAPAKSAIEPAKGKHAHKSGAEAARPRGVTGKFDRLAHRHRLRAERRRPEPALQAPKIMLRAFGCTAWLSRALTGTVAIPAGGEAPLVFNLRFSLAGYQVGVRGQAELRRARELAHAAGIPQSQALAAMAGDPLTLDLIAVGPWLPPEENFFTAAGVGPAQNAARQTPAPAESSSVAANPVSGADSLTGTVTLRNANWKADYLANHLEITEATLHLDGSSLRWDPVVFTYGPVKGSAAVSVPLDPALPCAENTATPEPCPVRFEMQFADLDASLLESALLGAQQKTTLLSDLIDRLHPSASPPWPAVEGTIKADSLILGPVTLHGVSAAVRLAYWRGDFQPRCGPVRRQRPRERLAGEAGQRQGEARLHLRGRLPEAQRHSAGRAARPALERDGFGRQWQDHSPATPRRNWRLQPKALCTSSADAGPLATSPRNRPRRNLFRRRSPLRPVERRRGDPGRQHDTWREPSYIRCAQAICFRRDNLRRSPGSQFTPASQLPEARLMRQ